MFKVMEAMGMSDKGPAPEAKDALKPIEFIKFGTDICCDVIAVVTSQFHKQVEKMALLEATS